MRTSFVEPKKRADDELEESLQSTVIFNKERMSIGLFGPIGLELLARFTAAFEELVQEFGKNRPGRQQKQKIIITISSSGGDSLRGLAIYDMIRSSGLPIETVALGIVGSSALIIFLAGKKRYIYENTVLFSEPASQSFEKSDSREIVEREFGYLDLIDEMYSRNILERSKLTNRKLRKLEKRQEYITAQKAVELGLAHAVITNI